MANSSGKLTQAGVPARKVSLGSRFKPWLLAWSLASHFPVLDLGFLTCHVGKLHEINPRISVNGRIISSNAFSVNAPKFEKSERWCRSMLEGFDLWLGDHGPRDIETELWGPGDG